MAGKSVIGSVAEIALQKPADAGIIHKTNADFWDTVGNEALGVISLPYYGAFISESKHHLFSEITDKKVFEIGCGNERSLEYLSDVGRLPHLINAPLRMRRDSVRKMSAKADPNPAPRPVSGS